MKKYLLFAIEQYYPKGGFGDFVTDFDSFEEIKDVVSLNNGDFDIDSEKFKSLVDNSNTGFFQKIQIVNTQNKAVVSFETFEEYLDFIENKL